MPIYMKYGELKGDVTAQGYEKWIELQTVSYTVHREVRAPTGRGIGREASAPHISEVAITKAEDSASGKLLRESLVGKGTKVTIVTLKTPASGSGKLEEVSKIELENTLITHFSTSGSGGDNHGPAHESLSLNGQVFTNTRNSPTKTNEPGTQPERVSYDAATTKTS